MPASTVWTYTGTITATGTEVLPAFNISNADEIQLVATLTGNAAAAAGDKIDIVLQSKTQNGIWDDRIRLRQLLGNMSSGEGDQGTVQKFGTFSDTEEAGEQSGSTGGSGLSAGTVKNGPFPPPFVAVGLAPASSWRLSWTVTSASAPSFPLYLAVVIDEPF
jgi:hypothetical protein